MEPRRALEILRRQSGCEGAGCQRAAACSQPARPAGDPVGIGQFDALDVVAIRVEHGAGPPACRLPVPGLGQPGHAQAVEVPGGCPGVIDVCVDDHASRLCVPGRRIITAVDQQTDPAELPEAICDSPSGPEGDDLSLPGRQADNGQSFWPLAATCPAPVP
jgi:hypothetical protein